MSDADEIRNLIAAYCLDADGGRFAPWAALFAEDGVLLVNGQPAGRGPAELARWIGHRPLPDGYHMVSNLRLDLQADSARAEMNFATILAEREVGVLGKYYAHMVRTAAGWRIREWRIETHRSRSTT